jgi:hypothetical protein
LKKVYTTNSTRAAPRCSSMHDTRNLRSQ